MNNRNNGVSRRGFIDQAFGLAAGLAAIPAVEILAQTGIDKKMSLPEEKKPIIYRTLGRTGIKIPVVGMGVMNAEIPEVIQASYEEGVRFFDTAAVYQGGKNEIMVGRVIKKLGTRDKVIIATKIFSDRVRADLKPAEARKKIIEETEESLGRLETDYIDILYVHGVTDPAEFNNPGVIEGLNYLKEQKKIRFTGVSSHSKMTAVIKEVTKGEYYDVALLIINYALSQYADYFDALKTASDKGIGIIAMKPFWGGPDQLDVSNAEFLKEFSSRTIASACLKWVLKKNYVTTTIPGYTNFDHMRENFAVARDLEYTEEEKKFLAARGATIGFNFCHQCDGCLASCPNDVEIPTLMRVYMYAAQYGNHHQARFTLDTIPTASGIQNCYGCEECTASCVRDINIAGRIERLKLIYA